MNNNNFVKILNESNNSFNKLFESTEEDFGKPKKDDTNNNYKVFENIIKEYPHMGTILEKLYTSPMYAIANINIYDDSIVFYMNQSMAIYFKPDTTNLMNKYKVVVQAPGNQSYSYSINIKKK